MGYCSSRQRLHWAGHLHLLRTGSCLHAASTSRHSFEPCRLPLIGQPTTHNVHNLHLRTMKQPIPLLPGVYKQLWPRKLNACRYLDRLCHGLGRSATCFPACLLQVTLRPRPQPLVCSPWQLSRPHFSGARASACLGARTGTTFQRTPPPPPPSHAHGALPAWCTRRPVPISNQNDGAGSFCTALEGPASAGSGVPHTENSDPFRRMRWTPWAAASSINL